MHSWQYLIDGWIAEKCSHPSGKRAIGFNMKELLKHILVFGSLFWIWKDVLCNKKNNLFWGRGVILGEFKMCCKRRGTYFLTWMMLSLWSVVQRAKWQIKLNTRVFSPLFLYVQSLTLLEESSVKMRDYRQFVSKFCGFFQARWQGFPYEVFILWTASKAWAISFLIQ